MFWRCSMTFIGMLCLQIYYGLYCGLLLKEHLPRAQKKLERDCLGHHCKRSLKLCDWSCTQVSFLLLTAEAGELTKDTGTEPGTISNHFESLQKLGRLAFSFTYIDELKIKYFFFLFFSNADTHRFLWFCSLIESL